MDESRVTTERLADFAIEVRSYRDDDLQPVLQLAIVRYEDGLPTEERTQVNLVPLDAEALAVSLFRLSKQAEMDSELALYRATLAEQPERAAVIDEFRAWQKAQMDAN